MEYTVTHRLLAAFRIWRSRREIARLADLDETSLRDIGLTPNAVRSSLGTPFYRDPSAVLKRRCCEWLASRWPAAAACC